MYNAQIEQQKQRIERIKLSKPKKKWLSAFRKCYKKSPVQSKFILSGFFFSGYRFFYSICFAWTLVKYIARQNLFILSLCKYTTIKYFAYHLPDRETITNYWELIKRVFK
jgi:hypothetical protein